jgi:hypothetical protein
MCPDPGQPHPLARRDNASAISTTATPWRSWAAPPTPADAGRLSLSKIRSALKAAGRQRNLDSRALQIQEMLRSEQLAAPAAFGASPQIVRRRTSRAQSMFLGLELVIVHATCTTVL